jgi:hypothetical protein
VLAAQAGPIYGSFWYFHTAGARSLAATPLTPTALAARVPGRDFEISPS